MIRRTYRTSALLRLAQGALVALVFSLSPLAHAEPTAQERLLAEALFRDAKELMEKNEIGSACSKFEESHRLDPKPGTILNLAVCQEKQGKTASALANFREAATLAMNAGQKDRAAFARERVAALEPMLSRFILRVDRAESGMEVKLDGIVLKPAAWKMAVPIDPGEHEIVATAPGLPAFSRKITVAADDKLVEILIPALLPKGPEPKGTEAAPNAGQTTEQSTAPVKDPGPAPETTPGKTAPTPGKIETTPRKTSEVGSSQTKTPPPSDAPRGSANLFWAGVAAGGVGLAGIVVGSIFGMRTFELRDEGNTHCALPDYKICTQAGLDLHADAESSALASTVGFGVGLAGLGAGVTLVLLSRAPSSKKGSPTGAYVLPIVERAGGGMVGGFSF